MSNPEPPTTGPNDPGTAYHDILARLANLEAVAARVSALEDAPGGGAVESVNTQTGVVVLDAADVGAQPAPTGTPDGTKFLADDDSWKTPDSGASVTGALRQAPFLFTEEATSSAHSYAITAVDTGAGSFTIAGDHTDEFKPCTWFNVEGSTANDGPHGITSAVFSAGSTVLVSPDGASDATVDGVIKPAAYKAEFTIPALAIVKNVIVLPLAQWAADNATPYIADESHDYFGGSVDLAAGGGLAVFDPTAAQGSRTAASPNFMSAGRAGGDYAKAMSEFTPVSTNAANGFTGPGVRYDAETDLYIQILTSIAAPPVVPTGSTIVIVEYFDAATPTVAAFL